MNSLKYAISLALVMLLAACGGGGGNPGTPIGGTLQTSKSLSTNAPASLTVGVGSAQAFNIYDGTPPYTAVSNNAAIAVAGVNGSQLTLGGVTPGTAEITIRDEVGATVTVSMSVRPVLALYTNAPPPVTVAIGASPVYTVGGGTPPYTTATSSNPSVATVTLAGSNLTVNGKSAGSANVVVFDSTGASVTVAVTVPTTAAVALYTNAPSPVTVAIGDSPVYTVGGGTPPYTTATSSNRSVATVTLAGSNLTVNGKSAGSANVVVFDSAGASVTVAVTVPVIAIVALYTSAPSPVTVAIGASPVYTVGGGTPPYTTATSSNLSVATVTLAGSSLTITGVGVGSANILVLDSAGAPVTVIVNVETTALAVTPSNATGIIGDVLIATITGGTAPYRASVGNVQVASASVQSQNELQITLKQVGQTIVTVLDANNQSIAYTLTSNAATPGIRLSPNAVTVSEYGSEPILFTVYGAAPGTMNVFSSDVTRLKAAIAGQVVTVTTGTNGNRCVSVDTSPVPITVIDSTGAFGVAVVTIQYNGGTCPPP